MAVVATVVVVVAVVVVVKVLVYARVVVNMTVELFAMAGVVFKSLSNVVIGGIFVLEFVVPILYFVKVISEMVFKALAVSMGVEVLTDVDVNVSVVTMTLLEFPMSIS